MKQLICLIILAIAIPDASFAQKTLSQGLISYDLKIQLRRQVAKKNPAIAALVPEVVHTSIEVPFQNEVFAIIMKPNKSSKGSVQMTTSGGNTKQIINLKTKTARTEEVVNGRSYYTEDSEQPAVVSYQSGTKQIAGYNCNKATVTTADKKQYTIWYTTSIPKGYNPNGMELTGIKGAVLEFGNEEMTCTAVAVNPQGFTASAIAPDSKAKKVSAEQLQDLQDDATATEANPSKPGQQRATQTMKIEL